ncbi:exported hypothetical protein [Candidatus Terasakiella magnetica]|uniref:PDZ domain-containing protein n=1 Tax=Candidatus Terasakiella magnetica TaxID=1867952 RepID=A0A1C3RL98_9PROT|nr:PDZ domain-containing protein [Candidatus Terasakiella magnetica]SCA58045.1 exported hypothetical protein [Candidatus Terasakiella magnetica]
MFCPLLKSVKGIVFAAMLMSVVSTVACANAVTPFFGMQIQGLSPIITKSLGVLSQEGVLVRDIAYPGPASHSDVRRGDIIVMLDGKVASNVETVVKMAKGFKPNTKVAATLLRRGKKIDVEIPIGVMPPLWNIQRNKFATIAPLGISFAALTEKVKERFNLGWRSRGVVVSLVDEEKAAGLDIKVGDVVVQVNQSPVWKPAHIISFIKKAQREKREMVLLLVEGASGFRFVLLPVPTINASAATTMQAPLPNLKPSN